MAYPAANMAYPPASGHPPPYCAEPGVTINPPVPYNAPLTSLCDGCMITINGRVLPKADRFHVNLCMGNGNKCDKALHVNPRFGGSTVVRNSFLGGVWGTAEKDGPGFPLRMDENFEVIILVTDACYKVAFNGQHFCNYNHRAPKEYVSCLVVAGDIAIHRIKVTDPRQPMGYPFAAPQGGKRTMALPHTITLPKGATPGTVVRVKGMPKMDAVRMRFDFVCKNRDNLAFTFAARFDENAVVRNTKIGKWGDGEKTKGNFPFVRGREFDMIFYCDPEKYQVTIDGKNFASYNHRVRNVENVIFFTVHKDVDLFSVETK